MIEFDVDMGYLLEAGELDCVVLNDENGEHESMEFVPKLGSGTCRNVSEYAEERNHFECSECGCTVKDAEDYWVSVHGHGCNDFIPWRFCPNCGAKVVTP